MNVINECNVSDILWIETESLLIFLKAVYQDISRCQTRDEYPKL